MSYKELFVAAIIGVTIATYLIAEEGLGKPVTYKETFEILGQAGLIPYELAEKLSGLAGLRDVLIHICWQLGLDQVHDVLQNDLETLKSFLQEVKRLLDQDSSAEYIAKSETYKQVTLLIIYN